MRSSGSLLTHLLYSRHAKSQCRPSSREISSFEKARPCEVASQGKGEESGT
jgi:hypothetical protein